MIDLLIFTLARMPYQKMFQQKAFRLLLLLCLFLLAGCRGPAAAVAPTLEPQPVQPTQGILPAAPIEEPTFPALTPTVTPQPVLEKPLVWYVQGAAPENAAAQMEALNRVLAERGLNAQVDIRYIESGLFERRMADIRSGGAWDLVTLSGAQYDLWLSQSLLLPIPQEVVPSQALDALVREGKVYAAPAPAAWAKPRGISIRADIARALDLQADLKNLRSFQDVSRLLAKIQSAIDSGARNTAGIENADALQYAAGSAAILYPEAGGFSSLWGPLVIKDEASSELANWYETAAFQQLAALRWQWQQSGLLPGEPLTPDQLLDGYREGRFALEIGHQVFPGSAARQAARYGYEWIDVPLTPAWISTEEVLSSVTSINAQIAGDTTRVQRALLLLEQARSDPEIFASLSGLLGWEGGVSLEEIARWNSAAQAAPGLGFVFDPRPVAAEAAAVTGAVSEYLEPLANGQSAEVDRSVKALNQFLETTGLAQIQAALEQQYAEWRFAQK